ncbi:MAG: glycosyltransferase family 8 protein [Verrucomicrobiales bacterium]|jgi:lipopolysaccharide biosynthesis glycosyltransferase|nr:glycosyltransferase family 8 protein [Verrucomicrobiales bacterium]
MSAIAIVFSLDDYFARHAGVAAQSILSRSATPSRFHFYFLQDNSGLSAANREKLSRIIQAHGAEGEFVAVDAALVEPYRKLGPARFTAATWYRLLAPSACPQLARCLYLDCDVVAIGDVAELWDTPLPETGLAAVADCFIEREKFKRLPGVRRYFNSGVLLMNLQRWREQGYTERCLALAADRDLLADFPDQNILNMVFSDDVHFLHPRWNIQTGQQPLMVTAALRDDWREWREICQSPKIAHFTSDRKPWNFAMKHGWSLEYWRTLMLTPWGAECSGAERQRLMWRARSGRAKALASRFLRWLLMFKKSEKTGAARLVLCGRLVIDKKGKTRQTAR